jgi:glycerol-1-phosphate dehydrogenase [NAD(P)+]
MLGTAYSEAPFRLQAADEPALLADAGRMAAGDLDAIAALARLLVLSGLGMVLAGGSQPASQAEHLISHYIDMLAGAAHPGSLHGEQVGVATLTVSRLQQAILDADRPPLLHPTRVDEDAMLARFGPTLGPRCIRELRAKALDQAGADRLNAVLAERWPALTARLRPVMLPTERLRETIQAAGAPTTGAKLGLSPAFYRKAVRHAREVRNRFTILDLAADAGLLDGLAAVET